MIAVDEDLLTPSLTEEDDLVGFSEPWNPMILVIITFFFGLVSGGLLLILNHTRLGIKKYTTEITIAVALIVIAMCGTLAWMHYNDMNETKEDRQITRLVRSVVGVVAALSIARLQKKRYRLATMSDVPEGKLFFPAVIAILIGNSIFAVLISMFIYIFHFFYS